MLLYDNRERLRILLQIEGSVLHKAFSIGFLTAVCTFLLVWWIYRWPESFWKPTISASWAADVVGTAVSFALVYRTTMAWTRQWEAAYQLQVMWTKWLHALSQLNSFITTAEKQLQEKGDPDGRLPGLREFRRHLAHNFSLLSALSVHRLTHGDLNRMRRRSEKFEEADRCSTILCCLCHVLRRWSDLIVRKPELRVSDLTNPYVMPLFEIIELQEIGGGVCTPARGKVQRKPKFESMLTRSTINSPRSVSSKSLMQAASKSVVVPSDKKPTITLRQQNSITLCEVSADPVCFGNTSVADSPPPVVHKMMLASNVTWSSDLVVLGELSRQELLLLGEGTDHQSPYFSAVDRVTTLMEWVEEDIQDVRELTGMPASIISQPMIDLSAGYQGLSLALRIADVPFPFPFSQLLEFLLVVFTCLIPIYAANFSGGFISSPLLAWATTAAFWSLSEISFELETPFADGPNQLPVIDSHERFVEAIQAMHLQRRPTLQRSKFSQLLQQEDPPQTVVEDLESGSLPERYGKIIVSL